MARHDALGWVLLVWAIASHGAIAQDQPAPQDPQDEPRYAPLPDGWKKAKFGMSLDEVLSRYPNAAADREEPDLLAKAYVLIAPAPGIGRVTFFFFRDRLFRVAVNFDLNEFDQQLQIGLFEKKYGPCQEKDISWRGTENATKIAWRDGKHSIELGQLVTASGSKDVRVGYYLAAIYTDLAAAAEQEHHVKTQAPKKHALGWDDF